VQDRDANAKDTPYPIWVNHVAEGAHAVTGQPRDCQVLTGEQPGTQPDQDDADHDGHDRQVGLDRQGQRGERESGQTEHRDEAGVIPAAKRTARSTAARL